MILQVVGIIGMATVLFICSTLAQAKNTRTFVVVGQDVFKWMCLIILSFIVTRTLALFVLIDTPVARGINSVVFLTAVAGIVWSVYRHGSADK